MATETIEAWPLDSIFERGSSGEYYPVHLELVDVGDGVQKFALVSDDVEFNLWYYQIGDEVSAG